MPAGPTHAGVLVFRESLRGSEFLVVSASGAPEERVIPKGHIEPGEDAASAALREAREEAGVMAEILAPLGESVYTTVTETVRVRYFLARHLADVPADEARTREWLGYDAALSALTYDDAKEILKRAGERLKGVAP